MRRLQSELFAFVFVILLGACSGPGGGVGDGPSGPEGPVQGATPAAEAPETSATDQGDAAVEGDVPGETPTEGEDTTEGGVQPDDDASSDSDRAPEGEDGASDGDRAPEGEDGASDDAPEAKDTDTDVSDASAVVEPSRGRAEPTTCSYTVYNWSTVEKRGVNHRKVEKAYSEVDGDERNPDDPRCTLCSEDQRTVDVGAIGFDGVGRVEVCWAYADQVEAAFRAIKEAGDFDIVALDGYRVGRTRGKIVDGLRTELSNHSYGTAIDINAKHNGLYGKCDIDEVTEEALGSCRLRIGGKWRPKRYPRKTVVRGGSVYEAFTAFWKWGGEIRGGTRDLMHFSVTGY